MTTIKLKNGSGAPAGGDLVQGEPALDLTNKRLYTEDSGGNVIEVGTNPGVDVTFADNRKAVFGAGSDLQIYHSGTSSFVRDLGDGDLNLWGTNVTIGSASGNLNLTTVAGGATTLLHGNAAKLATTSTGIDVTGTVVADGLESSGGLSFTAADGIDISGKESIVVRIDSDDNDSGRVFQVLSGPSASQEILIQASEDAGASLYYDNSAKLATTSTGIDVTGSIVASGDLQLGSDAVASNINALGDVFVVNVDSNNNTGGTPNIQFKTSGNEKLRVSPSGIDVTGRTTTDNATVGSGTASTYVDLTVNGASTANYGPMIELQSAGTAFGKISSYGRIQGGTSTDMFVTTASTNSLILGTNNTERMRIDSSGNLLVGTTTYNSANQGILLGATGVIYSTGTSGISASFGRNTTDGSIVNFRKDNLTVGSIGSYNGVDLYIGDGEAGLKFSNDNNSIIPWNTSSNASRDNNTDLGEDSDRFRNLYLSGGAYLGGTGSANKLDDYEEGTFTPTWTPASGSGQTVSIASGHYTKVGNRVFVDIYLATNGHGTASGNLTLGGLPFAQANNAGQNASLACGQAANAGLVAGQSGGARINQAATTFTPLVWSATTGTTTMTAAQWGVSGTWRFTGSYQV